MSDTNTASDPAAALNLAGQNGSSPTLLPPQDADPAETQEWLDSLEYVLKTRGPERVRQLLGALDSKARQAGVEGAVVEVAQEVLGGAPEVEALGHGHELLQLAQLHRYTLYIAVPIKDIGHITPEPRP